VFRSKRHRQATRVASAVLAGLGALATGVYGNASQAASSVKIGVPAYFWPGGYWDRVVAGSADISLAVVNIATGPGAAKNTAFATQFAAARNAGIKLVGYVDTTYGARSAASVKTDIANYKSWYGITSIFFDETPWSCDNTAYYADLSAVVHANGGTNIMNPGGSSLSCWGPIGDMIVNFEGSGATYESWAPDEWTNQYPASKFWHIVYGTLGPQVAETVSKTKARNAATVFITDDIMPNPFDRMPDPTVWAPTLKAIGPVAVAVTTATTPGATPAATAAPVAATVPAPVITFEAIATTTTEPPTTVAPTTLAPTTTVAPTTPPTTVAPTTSPTVAQTAAPRATAPAVTAAPALAKAATATPTPAAPAPAQAAAPSPAAPAAAPVANNPATVYGAAPTGGGVEIVNASDPAKPDSSAADSPKTDAAKPEPVKAEPVKSEAPAGSVSTSATVSGAAKASAPTTTLPNSLALKTPETGKSNKPVVKAKPGKKPAKVPAKPVAKAPSKIIAKAGPKVPIAKAPATNIAAKPVAARPVAALRP
jgi:Spherulation-specific family 4